MGQSLVRILLAIEFLLALLAVFTLWSQVGGQYHLDLMAWYWKLVFGPAVAYVTVRATMAAIRSERAWNANTVAWLIAALALLAMMGVVTYHCHLYEPVDEDEMDSRSSLSGVKPAHTETFMKSGEKRG
jgi:hypothetical protein